MTPTTAPEGLPVYACAVIGYNTRHGDDTRAGEVMLVRYRNGWALPGAWVRFGERVEDALNRGVHEALGVPVCEANFCAIAEDLHGLTIAFDVTTDGPVPCDGRPGLAWKRPNQLENAWPMSLLPELQPDTSPWLPRRSSAPGGTDGA